MFSLSSTLQPQVTVPLSYLITAFHSPKTTAYFPSSASLKVVQREVTTDSETYNTEPVFNLRDLGLSELRTAQLDKIFTRLLPGFFVDEKKPSSHWHTSHISAQSFFENKNGYPSTINALRPHRHQQQLSPLKQVCAELQQWPVYTQSRGFKTVHPNDKHLQSTPERIAATESSAPSFLNGFLRRSRIPDVESKEKIVKSHVLDAQQEAFRTGFSEGFAKSQSVSQKSTETLKRTRYMVLAVLLIGIYALSKTIFFPVRFRTTGLDASVDPVQIKNVKFEHVKGVQEAKVELQEVVEFLKSPRKFTVLGGKLPKGILLIGPPGTGKTLLARAVAGEADVPFYYATGSEFDEMFVGVGASRIRNLFREAKANAPCVIFIDELDSVGGKRVESPMHPYSRQTINQLLAEMDGFKPNEGVIIIGATNFPEALDNALVRPGRFDMQVTVPRPDVKGRTEILKWYLGKIKYDESVEAEIIARGTVGFSGAELENLVNQAALKAAVDGKSMVTMRELEFSKDKILMGPERRSVEIDNKNKTITAYHESGHAIIAYFTKDAMPINKATIMPRGPTLGHVSLLPENDRWSETKSQLLAQMDVSMGGRVAEEIIFGPEYITHRGF
ncbi:unnamed protein product [Staurois parvus]|uniref:AAA+ ATPase domain-containing protein n=1 Tax=Staurois parvus TaxID=386267 RepID=A0ABN9CSA5_9NEOB|nr:unnamed protein product [Staurois parvus]